MYFPWYNEFIFKKKKRRLYSLLSVTAEQRVKNQTGQGVNPQFNSTEVHNYSVQEVDPEAVST